MYKSWSKYHLLAKGLLIAAPKICLLSNLFTTRIAAIAFLAWIIAGISKFQYPHLSPCTNVRQQACLIMTMLSGCLDCALVYGIWIYYGNSEPLSNQLNLVEDVNHRYGDHQETAAGPGAGAGPASTATSTFTGRILSPPQRANFSLVIPVVTTTSTPNHDFSDPVWPGTYRRRWLNAPAGLCMGGLIGSFLAALVESTPLYS
ncbi:uncharacterized protein BJX67DRAFT_383752 [Aspergillus lucknowensis]|uniref:Uncharacterized protein n=1 Tax=Aspergillus lucknowensis TaxID=176173 RepID=A0ABR4LIX9_9EURO